MKIIFILSILFTSLASYAQKIHGSTHFHIPRDKVKLKNEDTETGKIIYYDSVKIVLRKYDYSEKNILLTDIDTIMGLSYFTYFLSPSIGYLHWKELVNQRLDVYSAGSINLVLKFGYMRKKHTAYNMDISFQGNSNLRILRFGTGIRRYLFSNYTLKKNFYIGLNFGYNIPYTNTNRFFDLGWLVGYEYHLMDKYRLFLEYNRSKAQKYTPKPTCYSLNLGIRFSTEFRNYYKKVNSF